MNIVILIGNGFDLKFNLKTRYTDFYDWYRGLEKSGNEAVDKFRSSIDPKLELWADLEFALGKYLKFVSSEQEAIDIFEDLIENLRIYIQKETEQVEYASQVENKKFISNFFSPDTFFRPAIKSRIAQYFGFWNSDIDTKVILFNYSNTLEKLLNWDGLSQRYSLGDGRTKNLSAIEHVHGFCDDRGRMALGLDSADQIDNEELRQSIDIVERFVKPSYNDTYELDHHKKCLNWIDRANVIITYGLSWGDTDKTWWNAISHQMLYDNNTILIPHFYQKGCTLEGNSGPKYQQQVRRKKEEILHKMKIGSSFGTLPVHIKSITDRIFPTFSEEMFSLNESY